MTTNKKVGKCLWMCVVVFMTYLIFGSFIVSKNIYDLVFLFIFYLFLIIIKIHEKNKIDLK